MDQTTSEIIGKEKEHINYLLYDKECPFCHSYVRYIRLKKLNSNIELLNARNNKNLVTKCYKKGLDINEGMILNLDGNIYFGAQAIHILALMSTSSNLFNRINKKIFQHQVLANLLYPVLRCGRNIVLRFIGKNPIEL